MASSQVTLEMNGDTAKLEVAFAKLNEKVRDLQGQLKDAGGAGKKAGDDLGSIGDKLANKLDPAKLLTKDLLATAGALGASYLSAAKAIDMVTSALERSKKAGKDAADAVRGGFTDRASLGGVALNAADLRRLMASADALQAGGVDVPESYRVTGNVRQAGLPDTDIKLFGDMSRRGLSGSQMVQPVSHLKSIFLKVPQESKDVVSLLLAGARPAAPGQAGYDPARFASAVETAAPALAKLDATPQQVAAAVATVAGEVGLEKSGTTLNSMAAEFGRQLKGIDTGGEWAGKTPFELMLNAKQLIKEGRVRRIDERGKRGPLVRSEEELYSSLRGEVAADILTRRRGEYDTRQRVLSDEKLRVSVDPTRIDAQLAAAQAARAIEGDALAGARKGEGGLSLAADAAQVELRRKQGGGMRWVNDQSRSWMTDQTFLSGPGSQTEAAKQYIRLSLEQAMEGEEVDFDALTGGLKAIGGNFGAEDLATISKDTRLSLREKLVYARNVASRTLSEAKYGTRGGYSQSSGPAFGGVGNYDVTGTSRNDEKTRALEGAIERIDKSLAEISRNTAQTAQSNAQMAEAEAGRQSPALVHPRGDENR